MNGRTSDPQRSPFLEPLPLILRSYQAPGDTLMLTAAVRDLHTAHPRRFLTDVRTPHAELWQHNPYLTSLRETGAGTRVLDMAYPLVHQSNQRPYHFLHGFAQFLEEQLAIRVPVTRFHGDIHLSEAEHSLPPHLRERGVPDRYWIMLAGGKTDFTTKWWSPASYQAVVDHFRGRITFLQCGAASDWHPALKGVVPLVGRTSLRDFVRLMYFADGVVCPLTFAMHLAAAVPSPDGRPPHRPCVVVAGGREPAHWTAYPHHQFLGNVGQLPCCRTGGCWRSRCQLVGDGDSKDTEGLCEFPVEITPDLRIPECMARITPREVIERIELHRDAAPTAIAATPKLPGPMLSRISSKHLRVGIEFNHGAVPAVMFTAVLASMRQYHPGWQITIRAADASAWVFRAPAGAATIEKPPSFANCDRIIRIGWNANRSAYAEYPSTPTTQCLLEELGIRPRLLNLSYTYQPELELLARRDLWLREHGLMAANSIGRGGFVLIDLPVNSWLKEARSTLQSMVIEHGIVPVWLMHPEVADSGAWQISLDREREWMNSAELAALIHRSKGVIASCGLPLYLAAATSTPAVGLWRDAHPVQEMDLSEYIIHLVPNHHREFLNGRAAEEIFARQYRHRIYDDVDSILVTLRDWLACELPRVQALFHRKSS